MRTRSVGWLLGVGLLFTGCVVAPPPAPAAVVSPPAPPPVRVETPPPAPSPASVWIAGQWAWRHGRYVWIPGS